MSTNPVPSSNTDTDFDPPRASEVKKWNELGHEDNYGGVGSTGWQSLDAAEENVDLQWPLSVAVYDRMARTDGQVAAIERAITYPLRRVPWHLRRGGSRDDVYQWVAECLGIPAEDQLEDEVDDQGSRRGKFQWQAHLTEAFKHLRYGHMPFEKIWSYDAEAELVRIKKLAPRMPHTIVRFNVARDGGLISLEQEPWHDPNKPQGLNPIVLPAQRLLVYVNDREGAAWTGTSIYRPAYKHWKLKDRLYRTQQLIAERGAGVPIAFYPKGSSPDEIRKHEQIARGYRVGESSGGALPEGADLRLKGIEGTIPDTMPIIQHHDESMARSMMAQFMMLGQANHSTGLGGSLGDTFLEVFYYALQTVLENVQEVANYGLIYDLVSINYGTDEKCPVLVPSDVGAEQMIDAKTLHDLIQVGAIQPDEALRKHLRRFYKLPDEDPTQAGPALPAVPGQPGQPYSPFGLGGTQPAQGGAPGAVNGRAANANEPVGGQTPPAQLTPPGAPVRPAAAGLAAGDDVPLWPGPDRA